MWVQLGTCYSFNRLIRLCFPGGSAGKESTCKTGDLSSIPGLGRSPREGNHYPFQCSGLEKSMGSQGVGHNWATFTFFQRYLMYRGMLPQNEFKASSYNFEGMLPGNWIASQAGGRTLHSQRTGSPQEIHSDNRHVCILTRHCVICPF